LNAPPLVFFDAAIDHVIRAARVFRQPGTHMLLVGIDGTGKATTCKLAAQIAQCRVYRQDFEGIKRFLTKTIVFF